MKERKVIEARIEELGRFISLFIELEKKWKTADHPDTVYFSDEQKKEFAYEYKKLAVKSLKQLETAKEELKKLEKNK